VRDKMIVLSILSVRVKEVVLVRDDIIVLSTSWVFFEDAIDVVTNIETVVFVTLTTNEDVLVTVACLVVVCVIDFVVVVP